MKGHNEIIPFDICSKKTIEACLNGNLNSDVTKTVMELINSIPELQDYALQVEKELLFSADNLDQDIRNRLSKRIKQKHQASLVCPQLFVDERYNIWLLENNGRTEVKMSPLCKTLYLLFLQYPQGISLYDMPAYQQELMEIYKKISSRNDYGLMKTSVNRLAHKLDNSIHDKLSRIKGVFNNLLSADISHYYYIKGSRRQEKAISLPRNLVIYDDLEK